MSNLSAKGITYVISAPFRGWAYGPIRILHCKQQKLTPLTQAEREFTGRMLHRRALKLSPGLRYWAGRKVREEQTA